MARPKQDNELDDQITDRQKLVRSTQDVAKVDSAKRGWLYFHPSQQANENFPIPVALNDWSATIVRGVWCAVPYELKAQLDNNRETRYRDVKRGDQTFKQPYEVQPYPFDWRDEFDGSLMEGNYADTRKAP